MRDLGGRVAYVLGIWFGCGLSPVAPGTVGSLGALPLYFAVRAYGPLGVLGAAIITGVVGIWAADVVAKQANTKDPQIVVIDEVCGVLITLAAAPPNLAGAATAFALFRLFDMSKPFPARHAERLKGGLGIVLDDVVAGIQGALVVLLLRRLGILP
ncbi:MAG: phosphatidylglycerophosphatase A [Polyangiaceae bacterium]|nr:phosphatidylglycerophosphatase A [Polyangiaceae bacterium]